MPIKHSKSPKAFQENIKREEKFGKPKKQAVKIAYVEAGKAKARDKKEAKTKKDPKPKAKNFIQKAIKHPGALHEQLHVPEGQKIPAKKLNAAAKKGGKLGQRARFAKTLSGLRK